MVQLLFVAGGRGRVRRLGDHMVFREGVVVGNPLTGTEFEEGTGTANERRGGGGGGHLNTTEPYGGDQVMNSDRSLSLNRFGPVVSDWCQRDLSLVKIFLSVTDAGHSLK